MRSCDSYTSQEIAQHYILSAEGNCESLWWCLWSCSSASSRLCQACGAAAKLPELLDSAHLHVRRLTSRPHSLPGISPLLFAGCCAAAACSARIAGVMHEIVTLQFGSQSNYLGTHFWNTQVSTYTRSPERFVFRSIFACKAFLSLL